MAFSSASWGFDPQAVSGAEIVGERMPERMGLRLDQTAIGEKTEAMVLAIGVDPLDALAQGGRRPCPLRSPCAPATPLSRSDSTNAQTL
jgi:hypothetical protein